jgi:uncharacterized cupredoxin-like copper-binding protein
MRSRGHVAGTAALLFSLAACSAEDVVVDSAEPGYVQDAPARVAAADWSSVETATIVLSEFAFSPAEPRFREGVPYRLRLENTGTIAHNFVSEGFFKAIAAQKLRAPTGEITTPYLKAIGVSPGETKDLYFVPVTKGTYDLECTLFLHGLFGMTSTITVE